MAFSSNVSYTAVSNSDHSLSIDSEEKIGFLREVRSEIHSNGKSSGRARLFMIYGSIVNAIVLIFHLVLIFWVYFGGNNEMNALLKQTSFYCELLYPAGASR